MKSPLHVMHVDENLQDRTRKKDMPKFTRNLNPKKVFPPRSRRAAEEPTTRPAVSAEQNTCDDVARSHARPANARTRAQD